MLSARRLVAYALIALGALALPAGRSWSDPPTPEFTAWWNSLLDGGFEGPNTDGVMLDYTTTDASPVPTQAQVDALREQIKDLISHPRHAELAQMEYRRNNPPGWARVRIWRMGDAWRYSTDPSDSAGFGYIDKVWTEKGGWQLTAINLVAGDADSIRNSEGHRIDVTASSIAHDVSLFFGAQLGASIDATYPPPTVTDGKWTLLKRVERQDGSVSTLRAAGTWDQASSTGTVDRVDRETQREGRVSSERLDLSEWKQMEYLRAPIATSILLSRDGVARTRYQLNATAAFTKAEFEELTREPKPTSIDPIRGKMTYTSVNDLRKGTGEIPLADESSATPLAGSGVSTRSFPWRPVGWGALGLCVIALVAHRIFRRGG